MKMITGAFGTTNSIRNTVTLAIPLAITALGLSVAFRMKFWNIGGEGQILLGATAAMFVSMQMPKSTPGWALILLMFLAGFVGGAVWAIIPGLFRIQMKTNETLFTLMMNYIAICVVKYLYYEVWRDPARKGFAGIENIQEQAHLPKIFGLSSGIIIPFVLMLLIFILIKRTKLGFEIRVVGESEPTAHYAGINVKKVILIGILLSGGIVGLAGVAKLNGSVFTLSENLAGGAGFTAIVIAWLANLSAPFILIVALLIGALEQGAQAIQFEGVPAAVADIIQGLILMSVLGSEFFLRYKIGRSKVSAKQVSVDPELPGGIDRTENTEMQTEEEVE
jgi:simple sugar transport system permease protein